MKIRIMIKKDFSEYELAIVKIDKIHVKETGIKVKDMACFDGDAEFYLETVEE